MRALKRVLLVIFIVAAFVDYLYVEHLLDHSLHWSEHYHHKYTRGELLFWLWHSPTLFRFGVKGVLLFCMLWAQLPIFVAATFFAKNLERMILGE